MGHLTTRDLVCDQWKEVPPVVTADLTGKTVIVTGANTGLGFQASKHFARMNPTRLILACRNPTKGEAALERLEKETGYRSAELWIIDLSYFSSVKAFADKFVKDGGRLDLLVENAASSPGDLGYQGTADGWESTLQVNYLSLSLLALLLLPRMIETGREYATTSRLVVVTSEVHFWAKLEPKVLDSPNILKTIGSEEFRPQPAGTVRYGISKLLTISFVRILNDRIRKSLADSIIVTSVNPGFCHSEIQRSITGFRAMLRAWIMRLLLARTSEQGSRQIVYGAVGGAGHEDILRGAYISLAAVCEPSDLLIDKEWQAVQDRIWNEMVDFLLQIDPRVQGILDQYLTTSAK